MVGVVLQSYGLGDTLLGFLSDPERGPGESLLFLVLFLGPGHRCLRSKEVTLMISLPASANYRLSADKLLSWVGARRASF